MSQRDILEHLSVSCVTVNFLVIQPAGLLLVASPVISDERERR